MVTILRFANGILSRSEDEIVNLVRGLDETASKYDMEINIKKKAAKK